MNHPAYFKYDSYDNLHILYSADIAKPGPSNRFMMQYTRYKYSDINNLKVNRYFTLYVALYSLTQPIDKNDKTLNSRLHEYAATKMPQMRISKIIETYSYELNQILDEVLN